MTDVETPVFAQAPPEWIELPGGLALARCDPRRAAAAVVAINQSLEHLRPWMAWATEPATEAGIRTLLDGAVELWERRSDFGYSIIDPASEAVVGGGGLHGRLGPSGLEIGYWVHVGRIGRGLATETSRALTDAAFAIPGIERVRIQCEDTNVRSARVPEKLGYAFEGVTLPVDGPCEGRPTQIWTVQRRHWMSGRAGGAS